MRVPIGAPKGVRPVGVSSTGLSFAQRSAARPARGIRRNLYRFCGRSGEHAATQSADLAPGALRHLQLWCFLFARAPYRRSARCAKSVIRTPGGMITETSGCDRLDEGRTVARGDPGRALAEHRRARYARYASARSDSPSMATLRRLPPDTAGTWITRISVSKSASSGTIRRSTFGESLRNRSLKCVPG